MSPDLQIGNVFIRRDASITSAWFVTNTDEYRPGVLLSNQFKFHSFRYLSLNWRSGQSRVYHQQVVRMNMAVLR